MLAAVWLPNLFRTAAKDSDLTSLDSHFTVVVPPNCYPRMAQRNSLRLYQSEQFSWRRLLMAEVELSGKSSAQVVPLVVPKAGAARAAIAKSPLKPKRPPPRSIRLTTKQLELATKAAAAKGQSLNAFIVAAVMYAVGHPLTDRELVKVVREFRVEESRIGNNVNQIARHLNMDNPFDLSVRRMLHDIRRDQARLRLTVDQVLRPRGGATCET